MTTDTVKRPAIKFNAPKYICYIISIIVTTVVFHTVSFGQTVTDKLPKFDLSALTTNYSKDYLGSVFGSKISDSVQIVGLGEVSHGGYEPMAFKANMVRYLIEAKGYRKLLFEFSDMAGIRILRNYINSHNANDTANITRWFKKARFNNAISLSWMDVFKWVKRYNDLHPKDMVEVQGFDVDTDTSTINLILTKYIIPYNYKESEKYVYQLNSSIPDADKIGLINKWFASNEAGLKAKLNKDEFYWLSFYVHNTANGLKYLIKDLKTKPDTLDAGNLLRDSLMSNNVRSLTGKDKAIIWAHNGHVIRWRSRYMGNYLHQYLKGRYYVIATDFSKFAAVDVTNTDSATKSNKTYVTKIFRSAPSTAAAQILDKYGIAEGIFFHRDLINMHIKEDTNLIDAKGLYFLIPEFNDSFDALVMFANLFPNAK